MLSDGSQHLDRKWRGNFVVFKIIFKIAITFFEIAIKCFFEINVQVETQEIDKSVDLWV